jgi:hypothetical protein
MSKKRKLSLLIILSLLLIPILLTAVSYFFPILLEQNPFYKIVTKSSSDGVDVLEYERYTLIPTVIADIPKGWSVKTTNYRKWTTKLTTPYDNTEEEQILKGEVSIEIYKEKELVAYLTALTELGGLGGVFYKFPDSDPKEVEDFEKEILKSEQEGGLPGIFSIKEVKKDEYTEIDLFGIKTRRLKGNQSPIYLPNTNKDEGEHFTAPTNNLIIFLSEDFKDGPSYQVFYYNKEDSKLETNYKGAAYLLHLNNECGQACLTEENLLTVDSILNSMELRK